MKKDTDLNTCREQIDRIDRQIVKLLEERFEVVSDVIRYKERKDLPILDAAREQQKLEALAGMCPEGKQIYMEEILKKIMEESRRFQADHPLRHGLLGRSLGHSHSPAIHKMMGGYEYGLFEREPGRLDAFFAEDTWRGINVTLPYKRDVMQYCDEISETARACNSVNTIVRRTDKTLGYNTDYDGFRYVVEQSGIDPSGCKCLVLGSGGVSGTVCQVLKDLGADPVVIISRTGEENYGNLDQHRGAQVIVNATPVGMFPKAGQAAVDVAAFPDLKAVYDLIYNPLRTKLMLDAEAAGIPAFGGLTMLTAQAAAAVELFGYPLLKSVEEACVALRKSLENIVLIGMPGAGKTSVGQALAAKTGMDFVDLDQAIEELQGRSPEDIIRADGIDVFRSTETKTLRRLTREGKQPQGPFILACGGGIVEREENRYLVRENGLVIWLERDLADLPLEGRPVSQEDGPEKIYERRKHTYAAWSDLRIVCCGVEETAEKIRGFLEERSNA